MQGKLRNMTSIYLSKDDKVLLLYRQGSRVVNNVWIGSAGGHFEEYELNDAKACALRELKEELGLEENDIDGLALRYITLRWTKGEVRQNYFFFAKLKQNIDENLVSNEGICKWFSYQELDSIEMSFSAKYVMKHYTGIGCHTDKVYVGAANSKDVQFMELPET